ncbi:MAG: PorT family protein [Bacteroidales bacterium]|nr:PorT family protein [Bacteroidales bacterium]
MKKILFTLALLLTLGMGAAQAQWSHFGAKLGLGYATYVDDLITSGGIMATNLGGFAEYGFEETSSFLLENVSIQVGMNFIRRGYRFEEVYQKNASMSLDYGRCRAWYVQLPVLARYEYELPVNEAGHNIVVSFGPAFSFGMFGRYRERKISPQMPQESMNFDTYTTQPKSMRGAFKHIRRPDVNFLLNVGYQHSDWELDLSMDYGFLAVSLSDDRVRVIEKESYGNGTKAEDPGNGSQNVNFGRTVVPQGNNLAFFLTATYRIPFVNR